MKDRRVEVDAWVLAAILIIALVVSFGIKDHVPLKVKGAVAKEFPGIGKVKWQKETATGWEAKFNIEGIPFSTHFLEDGTWVGTEHEVGFGDIDSSIKGKLMSDFPEYEVEKTEISETAEGSFYVFEIKNGKDEIKLLMDSTGNVIKKKIEVEDDIE